MQWVVSVTNSLFEGHQLSVQYLSFTNINVLITKEEEKDVYLNFLNFLITDSIFLLDESLNKILELKELEAEITAQERQERTRLYHSQETALFSKNLYNFGPVQQQPASRTDHYAPVFDESE
ncbi:hypothetical protein LXL04_032548 [Taraxacum kok-saghyz]